jgi:hypothetical protein
MDSFVFLLNSTNPTNTTQQCTNSFEVNILFYVLAGSASAVALVVFWQLLNLFSVSRETGLKYEGKRLFHWVLGGSLLGRAFFCFVSPVKLEQYRLVLFSCIVCFSRAFVASTYSPGCNNKEMQTKKLFSFVFL